MRPPRLFKRKGSGYWWFRFQWGGDAYQESTRTGDKREARKIATRRRDEIRGGKPQDKQRRSGVSLMTLAAADIAEAEAKQLSPGYRRALEIYWRHLRDFFGTWATLADVTYDRVRDYEAARRKAGKRGIRGQSIREEVACLKRGFLIAERRRLITHVPGASFWPKIRSDAPHPGRRGKLIAMADLRAVMALLPEEIADELAFGVLTGLRREEITEVRASWLRTVDGSMVLRVPADATKTGEDRTVPCPPLAFAAFRRREELYGPSAPLFPKHDWRKRIDTACRKAGVPRFTYRDLRTTFATVAAALADLASVRDAMGHAGVVTTNVYLRGKDQGVIAAGAAVQAALVGEEE